MRSAILLPFLATVLISISAARPAIAAEAANIVSPEGGSGGGFERMLNKSAGATLAFFGVPVLLHTLSNLGEASIGKAPSRAWVAAGYMLGGLALAGGVLFGTGDTANLKSVLTGATLGAIGVFELVVTAYRHKTKGIATESLPVGPLLLPAANHTVAYGIGVRKTF
jgi:hypothetical protein